MLRPGSPAPGFSILTTSAPIQASASVHDGPASNWVRSRTFIPARQFSPLMARSRFGARTLLPCLCRGQRWIAVYVPRRSSTRHLSPQAAIVFTHLRCREEGELIPWIDDDSRGGSMACVADGVGQVGDTRLEKGGSISPRRP